MNQLCVPVPAASDTQQILHEVFSMCRIPWIYDFIFRADPAADISMLLAPIQKRHGLAARIFVNATETSSKHAHYFDFNKELIFYSLPAFSVGPITAGFCVEQPVMRTTITSSSSSCTSSPSFSKHNNTTSKKHKPPPPPPSSTPSSSSSSSDTLQCIRFVRHDDEGVFFHVSENPSTNVTQVDCLTLRSSTRLKRVRMKFDLHALRSFLRTSRGILYPPDIASSLIYLNVSHERRQCPICEGRVASSECDCPLPLRRPSHPLDFRHEANNMRLYTGFYQGATVVRLCSAGHCVINATLQSGSVIQGEMNASLIAKLHRLAVADRISRISSTQRSKDISIRHLVKDAQTIVAELEQEARKKHQHEEKDGELDCKQIAINKEKEMEEFDLAINSYKDTSEMRRRGNVTTSILPVHGSAAEAAVSNMAGGQLPESSVGVETGGEEIVKCQVSGDKRRNTQEEFIASGAMTMTRTKAGGVAGVRGFEDGVEEHEHEQEEKDEDMLGKDGGDSKDDRSWSVVVDGVTGVGESDKFGREGDLNSVGLVLGDADGLMDASDVIGEMKREGLIQLSDMETLGTNGMTEELEKETMMVGVGTEKHTERRDMKQQLTRKRARGPICYPNGEDELMNSNSKGKCDDEMMTMMDDGEGEEGDGEAVGDVEVEVEVEVDDEDMKRQQQQQQQQKRHRMEGLSEAEKVEMRKQRNREAAARSNLKRKLRNEKMRRELACLNQRAVRLRVQEMALRDENTRLRKAVKDAGLHFAHHLQ